MDDDEVAIVLGHELAHYTHEHSRRVPACHVDAVAGLGIAVAAEATIESERTRAIVGLASAFSLRRGRAATAATTRTRPTASGCATHTRRASTCRRARPCGNRFAKKYGQPNAVVNFFFSDHSQASARSRHLRREIDLVPGD
jgi:Zn-dependent protease with chaperone function